MPSALGSKRCSSGTAATYSHRGVRGCPIGRRCCVRAFNISPENPAPIVLVGDIGGTNARLATWKAGAKKEEIYSKTFPTSGYDTFEAVVSEFLKDDAVSAYKPQAATFAVAGAVVSNRCAMTNISWIVDGPALEKMLGVRVAILNDFEAVGYGIPALSESDIVPINDSLCEPKAPKVVMGPGTGLGAAQLMWDEKLQDYRVWPGEGAHATFAPRGWKQTALASFVTQRYKHCEIEQIACGSGLELIYEFLLSDEIGNRPDLLKPATQKTAAEISGSAVDKSDPLAIEAVDLFLAIIGAEAGAMALRCLAKGGVYIAGGIAPKLMERILHGSLLEGFLMRQGREKFHDILVRTPLFVITNGKVGQIGACAYASRLLS